MHTETRKNKQIQTDTHTARDRHREIDRHTTELLFLVLVVPVMMSPTGRWLYEGGGRCPTEMRNSTRFSQSWNTSVTSRELPKYRWRSAAHYGQKRSQPFPPKCHNVASSPLHKMFTRGNYR